MSGHKPSADTDAGAFAAALRRYRSGRRLSQLDLALTCDVSARHLSFLESGRAQPSRDMVLQLAEGLLLPLQARNALLLAAGYAPAFPASPLTSEALAPLRMALEEMMARHMPNPALLCDRHWTVRDANPSARALLAPFQQGDAPLNLIRLMSEGPGADAFIANLPEVIEELAARVRLEALDAGDDPELETLLAGLEAARLRHPAPAHPSPRRPLAPVILRTPLGELRLLSAITQFGTSEDVTVRDLRLELFFPADDATRAAIATLAG